MSENFNNSELTTWALQCFDDGQLNELSIGLSDLHPSQLALLLESVPGEQRIQIVNQLSEENAGSAIPLLNLEVKTQLLNDLETDRLSRIVDQFAPVDVADAITVLPESASESLLQTLDAENLARVNAVLEYAEGSAGRMMSIDALSVRPDVSLNVVLRWLRKKSALPSYTSALMVTDKDGIYVGKLLMSDIVTGNPDALVESVMLTDSEVLFADSTEHDVAQLFDQRHLIGVAVLDDQRRLVGRITIDNAMAVLKKEADHRLLSSRGLSDEADLFAPIVPSAKQRGVWLGINLMTVFLAAWVIGQFQTALDQLVALAVLMPIVASMGGIAGSQTLTLTIRGLALDQVSKSNLRWLATKELGVGALNGFAWAVVVAVVTYLWFNNAGLSIIIAVAMILNLLAASVSGVAVPIALKRMGFDPALSGAVVLTTVTDIVGFMSFLGLASWFLI